MIKYQGTRKGRKFIGFIVDDQNLLRMKHGEPILIDMAIFDIDADLMIEYTPDIRAKAKEMAPLIGPATLHIDTLNDQTRH